MSKSITTQGLKKEGFVSRIQAARGRYGSRAFAVALYRILFQWPRLRSKLMRLKIRLLLQSKIAPTVGFGKHISLMIPGGALTIGENSWIGSRCFIEIWPNPRAEINIGANCYLAHDIHLGAFREISIGDNVRIAEFTSLRDTSHNYKARSLNINQQGDTVGALIIEDDVWIGQGCILLGSPEGTVIGKGAVIGAHSVVKDSIPAYAIAVGAPARVINYRK